MIGINISGAEFGGGVGGSNGSQYHWTTLSELQFYREKGVDLVRLPFTWERMQPILGGELSTSELGLLKTFLSDAASLGMDVIIDLHNYGRYNGQPLGSSGGPTKEQFADFWVKLAGEIKGFSSLVGYDLMNEPHDMPSANAWKDAAQAAVNAIRTVDTAKTIFVEGNDWSGAWSWLERNADFIIKDPANKLVYQAHQYFDRDSSGTYSGSFDQEGAYKNVGIDRIKPFVDWLNAHGLKGMIGEFGAPSDDPRWLEVTQVALDYMKANDLIVTAWGGGTWWPTEYSMFMGAPGRTDSKFLDLLEGYFTPWSADGSKDVTPVSPTPEPVAPVAPTIVDGTAGADQLNGTAGVDVIRGLDGNDSIFGSLGADQIDGGMGIDLVDYANSTVAVNVDLAKSSQLGGSAEGDKLTSIENLNGSAFNDRLAGDAAANHLVGGAGDDVLIGRGGADRLDGGAGFDTASYEGSSVGVTIDLGRGTQSGGDALGDVFVGIEKIVGSFWKDSFKGTASNDSFDGGAGDDMFEGLAGADTIVGGAGVDTVSYASSNAGIDVNLYWQVQKGGHAAGDMLSTVENITGSRFNDQIVGNGDANLLEGGSGSDWLNGSWGADMLRGGAGRDTFVFDSVGNANGDRVLDFASKDDKLDFSAIDANVNVAGDQSFTFLGMKEFTGTAGELRSYWQDGSTWLAGDVNGDGVADFSIALNGFLTLNSTHFTL